MIPTRSPTNIKKKMRIPSKPLNHLGSSLHIVRIKQRIANVASFTISIKLSFFSSKGLTIRVYQSAIIWMRVKNMHLSHMPESLMKTITKAIKNLRKMNIGM